MAGLPVHNIGIGRSCGGRCSGARVALPVERFRSVIEGLELVADHLQGRDVLVKRLTICGTTNHLVGELPTYALFEVLALNTVVPVRAAGFHYERLEFNEKDVEWSVGLSKCGQLSNRPFFLVGITKHCC